MSKYGRISFSLIFCQMIRVISSPSISTTGFFTLILAIHSPCARRHHEEDLQPRRNEEHEDYSFDLRYLRGLRGDYSSWPSWLLCFASSRWEQTSNCIRI